MSTTVAPLRLADQLSAPEVSDIVMVLLPSGAVAVTEASAAAAVRGGAGTQRRGSHGDGGALEESTPREPSRGAGRRLFRYGVAR